METVVPFHFGGGWVREVAAEIVYLLLDSYQVTLGKAFDALQDRRAEFD